MRKNQTPVASHPPNPERRFRGFEPAGGLLKDRLRVAGESRGFAAARLLTHWTDIAGPELARITQPVKVGFPKEGLGATLTLLVAPAQGPIVQMALPQLIDRVNAVYGYRAIARISLTQTSASGFAEGQTPFTPAPKPKSPNPALLAQAAAQVAPVADDGLRRALESLARNILTRQNQKKGPTQ